MRIADESHKSIIGGIRRRERPECDLSRVFVAANEDSKSNEHGED